MSEEVRRVISLPVSDPNYAPAELLNPQMDLIILLAQPA
jgi:hypothetical protein